MPFRQQPRRGRARPLALPPQPHQWAGWRPKVAPAAYTKPQLMGRAPGAAPRAGRDTEQDPRLPAGAAEDVLASQLEICRNHNLLYALHYVDPRGRRTRITECARHRFAAPLDGGRIAALSVAAGEAEIVVLEQGKAVRSLYRTAPGESISGLAARG